MISRGRVVPTTPWESVWHAVAEWWDIDVKDPEVLKELLPNAANFADGQLFQGEDLFRKE